MDNLYFLVIVLNPKDMLLNKLFLKNTDTK